MPPFVGAVAMQLLFGRNGSINLLLDDWFGFKIPFMEGLNGVIFVQSVHYFPFILINLSAALRNIDRAMEEAAQNLGSSGFRLFRRIVFPLAMPGYLAGAALVFVKVFDDLATPLLLNVKDMLAPQAYLRVTSIGIADPMGYVIAVVLIVVSVARHVAARRCATQGRDYATDAARRRRPRAQRTQALGERRRLSASSLLILALVLAPHLGLLLLSFATVWSFSPLPDALHAGALRPRLRRELALHQEHADLRLARRADRHRARRRHRLSRAAHQAHRPANGSTGRPRAALAMPGVVLGIGYLRTFYGVTLPDGTPAGVALDHDRARAGDPAPALCAARLLRGACSRSRSRWRRPPRTSAPPRAGPCAASSCR